MFCRRDGGNSIVFGEWSNVKSLLIRFIVTFIAVYIAAQILPTYFTTGTPTDGLIFALVLAALNTAVRPIVLALTCPLQITTLGLITLVINAGMFLLAGTLANALGASGLRVDGFVGAFLAALVVSIISTLVSVFVKE